MDKGFVGCVFYVTHMGLYPIPLKQVITAIADRNAFFMECVSNDFRRVDLG